MSSLTFNPFLCVHQKRWHCMLYCPFVAMDRESASPKINGRCTCTTHLIKQSSMRISVSITKLVFDWQRSFILSYAGSWYYCTCSALILHRPRRRCCVVIHGVEFQFHLGFTLRTKCLVCVHFTTHYLLETETTEQSINMHGLIVFV